MQRNGCHGEGNYRENGVLGKTQSNCLFVCLFILLFCLHFQVSLPTAIIQEAAMFKLSSLQHQLSESVPAAHLVQANRKYSELVLRYQESLQKQTSHAASSQALEHVQVKLGLMVETLGNLNYV